MHEINHEGERSVPPQIRLSHSKESIQSNKSAGSSSTITLEFRQLSSSKSNSPRCFTESNLVSSLSLSQSWNNVNLRSGVEATVVEGPKQYFMGIVDILQEWDIKKQVSRPINSWRGKYEFKKKQKKNMV